MSSEDAFSSIQWDREDKPEPPTAVEDAIIEEASPSNSLLLATEPPIETSSLNMNQPTDEVEKGPEVDNEEAAAASEPEPSQQTEISQNVTEASVADVSGQQTTLDEPPAPVVTEPSKSDIEQRRMEEQFQKYFITLHVSHPISDRDGNSKSFISYLVTTSTDHPDIKKLSSNKPEASENDKGVITVKVRRRYGDFRFLHDCLINDFPQLLVPPLPPKLNFKYLTGDTFSTLFVHKRLHSLDRFLEFISLHKLLSQLAIFHYFISESAEWASFTKNLKIAKGGEDHEQLIVGKVVNEDLLTETVMNFFTSSKHKRETNKDILEISDKLKKLYENLIKLDKIFSKLNKKNSDLKVDYEQFLEQIDKLAAVQNATNVANELGQVDANRSIASVSDGQSAVNNFKVFSESLRFFLERWGDLHRYIDESFLVSLKDCAKYIVRFTDLIELQHNKKIDLKVLEDYLLKVQTDLANMGGGPAGGGHQPPPNPVLIGQQNGGIVNSTTQLIKDTLSTSATSHIGSTNADNKKFKLRQKIQQLEQEIKMQTEVVNDLTSRIINEEYPNWDKFNKNQLKQSMVGLCDQEITFYRGLVDNWSEVELKLMKRIDELS
ncbi:CIC11C00000002255 [Sungouiella intermedia]|uniref:Sorting nexin-4 n=1 Tax=Sungouiella intermedia TaxID=45354 RepID=A0A1L0BRH1_9ASCO|nr:CIC11C00000003087 [[Candida] intermedia]SGZ54173.1 CIC11C00000002255 [[Candida] intermedia]